MPTTLTLSGVTITPTCSGATAQAIPCSFTATNTTQQTMTVIAQEVGGGQTLDVQAVMLGPGGAFTFQSPQNGGSWSVSVMSARQTIAQGRAVLIGVGILGFGASIGLWEAGKALYRHWGGGRRGRRRSR